MRVWVTDWQLGEEHLLFAVGDTVDWTLYPADHGWLSELLTGHPVIEWQFDTYGRAVPQPSRRVSGTITGLESVRVRQIRTAQGLFVPVPRDATLQPVLDTGGSWDEHPRYEETAVLTGPLMISHTGSFTTAVRDIIDQVDEPLYGYVATLDPSGCD